MPPNSTSYIILAALGLAMVGGAFGALATKGLKNPSITQTLPAALSLSGIVCWLFYTAALSAFFFKDLHWPTDNLVVSTLGGFVALVATLFTSAQRK